MAFAAQLGELELIMQQYLSPREAASMIGVSPGTLAKWRCYGTGPKYAKVGRVCRYSEDAIHEWMREREHASTSEYDTGFPSKLDQKRPATASTTTEASVA